MKQVSLTVLVAIFVFGYIAIAIPALVISQKVGASSCCQRQASVQSILRWLP